MAIEAQVQCSLTITKGGSNLRSSSPLTSYKATLANFNGPTPGVVLIPTAGAIVNLSALTALGGLCCLTNEDDTNFVRYGVWTGAVFVPFGRLLPGEQAIIRLDDELFTGPTGTAHIHDLYMVANVAACRVFVGAHDP